MDQSLCDRLGEKPLRELLDSLAARCLPADSVLLIQIPAHTGTFDYEQIAKGVAAMLHGTGMRAFLVRDDVTVTVLEPGTVVREG